MVVRVVAKGKQAVSTHSIFKLTVSALLITAISGCPSAPGRSGIANATAAATLDDAQMENLVRRSYQYVAMYNVNNNFAMQEANPFSTNGWNKLFVPTGLMDHTVTAIARPNNDTLYPNAMLDMRDDAIVIHFPAFDSKYVSLETSAYDHYVDVPLSTTKGDFKKPTTMLFYTSRTKNYKGEPIKGIDKTLKMTGDFAIAFLRVAPHASEPARLQRNLEAMQKQKIMTLSEFRGGRTLAARRSSPAAMHITHRSPVEFPAFGNDQMVFRNNFLEVMQFVVNHTTFDPNDEMGREVLAALKPLGVEPGKTYDPAQVADIDGERLAEIAEKVAAESLAIWNEPGNPYLTKVFLPKGSMTLEPMVVQSCVGPIGLPYHQAQYPGIGTADGSPIMANKNYVIRMPKEELPPAKAFWSVTLYDSRKGLFIPNDHYKYSVGENGGMKLDASGGVEIHIAAERPDGVPAENWLPSGGKDERLDVIMRIYAPDLEAMKTWKAPKAEKL
jgi:hypothetical protein